MESGRIKVVANVQKATTLSDVVTFMQDVIDELGRQRTEAKMANDFHNFNILATKMKVIQNGLDLWQLYPKIAWEGELKQGRDEDTVQQEGADDLAVGFQNALESNGYTVLTMYIKNYG